MKVLGIVVAMIATVTAVMLAAAYIGNRVDAAFGARRVFTDGMLYISYGEIATICGALLLWTAVSGFLIGLIVRLPLL